MFDLHTQVKKHIYSKRYIHDALACFFMTHVLLDKKQSFFLGFNSVYEVILFKGLLGTQMCINRLSRFSMTVHYEYGLFLKSSIHRV